jgi:hypothetical protein
MTRLLLAAAAALVCLALTTIPVSATFFPGAAETVSERTATADVVVTGRVTGFADKTVSVEKQEYKVAIVKVTESILVPKDVKELRVGFVPLPRNGARGAGPLMAPFTQGQLAVGQEACFFLTRQPEGDFYTFATLGGVVDKRGRDYATTVAEARKAGKLLADPKASLTSKAAQDRFLTAALLVHRYRTPHGRQQTEPIDAEESKLILQALAEADWSSTRAAPGVPPLFAGPPHLVLRKLGPTEKDGWKEPINVRELTPAAKKWLKDNVETFRIQKYIPAEEKKKDE